MSRVDINAVDSSNFIGRAILEVKRVEESTLVEIQPVNFMTGSGDNSVAGWVVVSNRPTGLGYSCAVIEPALIMKGN